jgi:DNA-binding NtrC family response regulator
MIKRLVILQDERLVVQEMTRTTRPVHAYASAGALNGGSHPAQPAAVSDDEPDDADASDAADAGEDEAAPDVPVVMAPAGSRLADVAKAAATRAERAIIEETLGQVHWNRRRAAEQLGVSYKTLLNKIKECGIGRPR